MVAGTGASEFTKAGSSIVLDRVLDRLRERRHVRKDKRLHAMISEHGELLRRCPRHQVLNEILVFGRVGTYIMRLCGGIVTPGRSITVALSKWRCLHHPANKEPGSADETTFSACCFLIGDPGG
jgi:hypothetical protein